MTGTGSGAAGTTSAVGSAEAVMNACRSLRTRRMAVVSLRYFSTDAPFLTASSLTSFSSRSNWIHCSQQSLSGCANTVGDVEVPVEPRHARFDLVAGELDLACEAFQQHQAQEINITCTVQRLTKSLLRA